MRRARRFWAVAFVVAYMAVLAMCSSCVNTQQAIAPATLGDLWIGVEADVEQLLMLLLWI